jgi:hypothetical protein
VAKGAIFVGWGSIITGREKAAPGVLNNAMQYLMSLQKNGIVDAVEAVALEPHGGDLEGFVLIRGEKDALAMLRVDNEFVKVIVGVQLVHTKVGVVWAYAGAEMQSLFRTWDEQEEKLT